MNPTACWTIFCRVVDHFGDIGIAWRLAKQIARAGRAVRLVVDDLDAFARIEARVDPHASSQCVDGIAIDRWSAVVGVPDVVVELLGCGLPPAFLDAMARAPQAPVWIDYEYLSAEAWVDEFHAQPSPHPSLPLVKHFFYPGFGSATGGLLVEPEYARRRAAFLGDPAAAPAFRRELGIGSEAGSRHVSLFAYPHAPVAALLDVLAGDTTPWTVVVPDGVLVDAIGDWSPPAGSRAAVKRVPFLDQDGYDRLLWSCDWNAVRGEDSFVRAQLAGRPFVWQIYPQADDAHRAKLAAFDGRFGAVLDAEMRGVRDAWSEAWNGSEDVGLSARAWLATLPAQRRGAEAWRERIMAATPLVERLLAFAGDRRASP